MNIDVTLAVLLNAVGRLRDEQNAIKSMLVAMNVHLDVLAAHIGGCNAKKALASDLGKEVGRVRAAGKPVAAHPARRQ